MDIYTIILAYNELEANRASIWEKWDNRDWNEIVEPHKES